ncbi:MAG: DUF1614 domain-containing protein [Candidatus Methanomethylicia archaeon]
MSKHILYPPVTIPFMMLFLILLMLFTFLIFIDVIGVAFRKLGFSPKIIAFLLVASLIGSIINIPIHRIRTEIPVINLGFIEFFGVRYPTPYIEEQALETIVAVNVGGALIPILVSVYLIMVDIAILPSITLATVITTIVIHGVARPVRGLGIAIPTLIPPIVAVLAAFITGGGSPVVAYISGTLGTLIGADLLNIDKIPKLRAPVVSIGGAGTFDGIFLTGIIAALLT